jgi:hypothetical protein
MQNVSEIMHSNGYVLNPSMLRYENPIYKKDIIPFNEIYKAINDGGLCRLIIKIANRKAFGI